MTIKEFANLVECNPQTLRYYDREDLLKPVRVDQWSGYRYYEEEQALAFVKIKNLQKAGFAIDEIRELLNRDNRAIYEAFEKKIEEAELRLLEIRNIQKSYQSEMTDMKKKLENMRETIMGSMENYDPQEEFGIDKETYSQMVARLEGFFENMIDRNDIGGLEFSFDPQDDGEKEEADFHAFMNDPAYETVYEKHGWKFVKEFFEEFSNLEDGREYMLLFKLQPDKANGIAFSNTVLYMLLTANPEKKRTLGCNATVSKDGQNHFWLRRKWRG